MFISYLRTGLWVSPLSLHQTGYRESQAFGRSGRVLSDQFVHFKEIQRRDVMGSRLNMEPTVLQEPEARLPND